MQSGPALARTRSRFYALYRLSSRSRVCWAAEPKSRNCVKQMFDYQGFLNDRGRSKEDAPASEPVSDSRPKTLLDRVREHSGPFWILRGIVSSAAFLGLVAEYLGIPSNELARIVYAIFISWNQAMDVLGKALSEFLPILQIGSKAINAIIVFSAIIAPLFRFFLRTYQEQSDSFEKIPFYHFFAVFALIVSLPALSVFVPSDFGPYRTPENYPLFIVAFGIVTLGTMVVGYTAVVLFFVDRHFREAALYLVSFILLVCCAYFLPFASPHLKGYADSVLETHTESVSPGPR